MAFTVTPDTLQSLNAPRMESTIFSSIYGSQYSESVNSMWTHPNPYVLQVGNHLFHKDRLPHTLRFNDQKRDKEVLDNVRNRLLREVTGDREPAYTAQAVPPPPVGSYVPYTLSTKTTDWVGYNSGTKTVVDCETKEKTVTAEVPTLIPSPVFAGGSAKPYSPLALPYVPSGQSAYGYGYNYSTPIPQWYGGYGAAGYGGYGAANGGYGAAYGGFGPAYGATYPAYAAYGSTVLQAAAAAPPATAAPVAVTAPPS